MMKTSKKLRLRKAMAFSLAVMVGVSFLPLLGGASYATEGQPAVTADGESDAALADRIAQYKQEIKDEEVTDMPDVDLGEISGDELEALMSEDLEAEPKTEALPAEDAPQMLDAADLEAMLNSDAAPEVMEALNTDPDSLRAMLTPNDQQASKAAGKKESLEDLPLMDAQEDAIVKFTQNKKNGTLRITGQLTGDTYSYISVNNQRLKTLSGSTIDETLYMTNVPVDAYLIAVGTAGGKTQSRVEINIYKAPGNKYTQYDVYRNYFNYTTPKKGYTYDLDNTCGVYLEYKKAKSKKKKWTRMILDDQKNPLKIDDEYAVKKLSPGTKYKTRAYYGKSILVGGTYYMISGEANGCYSKRLCVKTGPKKLKFKSVTLKLTNVKKHTSKKYGSLGVYHGKVVWYTCKMKAIVKLKKKPGVKGMKINGKNVKGNKKTYTKKLGSASTMNMFFCRYKVKEYTWYKSDEYFNLPKGKKYSLQILTYNDKKYGGYSKVYTKNAKIR